MKFNLDENLEEGYKIKYPNDWQIIFKKEGAIVHYLAPLEDLDDRFRENLSIFKEERGPFVKLYGLIDDQIAILEKNILDFELIEKKKTMLSGNETYKLMFSGKKEGFSFIFLQYYMMDEFTLISLNFVAEKRKYDDYKSTVKKMIKSFEIL